MLQDLEMKAHDILKIQLRVQISAIVILIRAYMLLCKNLN